MQLELLFNRPGKMAPQPGEDWLQVGSRRVRLWLVPNPRARRYVLRLRPNGDARVAIPRRGSAAQARRFAQMNVAWLERQLLKQSTTISPPATWAVGTEILFRGEPVRLERGINGESDLIHFGQECVRVEGPEADLRPAVEQRLRKLAASELPRRLDELAALHGFTVARVTIRNQRSRWGSCSRRGTISLNWRLVQVPPFVCDYILLHELAHLKHMNHSRRFWDLVTRLCPQFTQAERWLKQHGKLLR